MSPLLAFSTGFLCGALFAVAGFLLAVVLPMQRETRRILQETQRRLEQLLADEGKARP